MRHPIRDSAGTGDQLGVAPVDENPPAATVWAGSIGPLPVTPPRSVPGPRRVSEYGLPALTGAGGCSQHHP